MFVREGLLERVSDEDGGILARNAGQTDEVFRLRAIGHSLQQAFERYYIAISVLVKNGAGTLSAGELESLCQLAAQRLSLLYAPAAPEFFDKTLFRGFIQKLRELRLVWADANGKLAFDERLDAWAKDAKVILGRELRHTIEKVSPEAAKREPRRRPTRGGLTRGRVATTGLATARRSRTRSTLARQAGSSGISALSSLRDAVLQPQLAFLQALDRQLVGLDVGHQAVDRHVEVAMLEPELGQLAGDDGGIGGFRSCAELNARRVRRQRARGR